MDVMPLALSDCLLVTRPASSTDWVAAAPETIPQGAVRGIHWAEVPPGRPTLVTCLQGAVLAVVVDLRVGSLTFGEYAAAELDDVRGRSVQLGPGLGHGVVALTAAATVRRWTGAAPGPLVRRTIHPLDPALSLPWTNGERPTLNPEDDAAPALVDALAAGLLPRLEDCRPPRGAFART